MQVRFNSHRLSGGAYIYPDAAPTPDHFRHAGNRVGARLITPASVQRRRDRAWNKGEGSSLPALEWEDCWTESTPLSYDVLIYPQYLRDPGNLGEHKPGDRFGYWSVATPQEAYRLVRQLVNFPVAR